MSDKKFILNADDFGMSEAFNRAVLEGYSSGILKSASLVANGDAFNEAWKNVIPPALILESEFISILLKANLYA